MPRAAVWRMVLQPGPQSVKEFKPFASGLRNSMALAVMPDGPAAGTIWQGENNIDYRDPKQPPEELNLLRAGADYGWPYCIGARQSAQGYEKRFDCSKTEAPHMLWPAHVAPLQMLATPIGSAFGGQLLVAWHGQRAEGQRLVGFARDGKGRPSGQPIQWLSNWDAKPGLRPAGRPTGMGIDHAGRLLVVEDFNRSLLVLMSEAGMAPRPK
jgi:glucose/arabinose dehydrogenase